MLHVPAADCAAFPSAPIASGVSALLQAKPFSIVAETLDQVAAREALLDRAMGPGRTRKASEAIRRGRAPAAGLAFAAIGPDGALLGTLRLWHVSVGFSHDCTDRSALLLGPLAIDPAAQGLGLGGAMMRHAVGEATRIGHGAIVLVGDPEYYGRFGFSSALTRKLAMSGPFEPRRLLALELVRGALREAEGTIRAAGLPMLPALHVSEAEAA